MHTSGPVGGADPVISSGRRLTPGLLAALVVAAFVVAGVVVAVVLARDDGSGAAGTDDQVGTVDAADAGDAALAEQLPGGLDPAAPASGPSTTVTPATVTPSTGAVPTGEPSESTVGQNLLVDGPAPALADLAEALGADTELTELVIYDTYAIATYRSPDRPGDIDRVVWRDGEVSAPEPVGFTDDYADALFTLSGVAVGQIPALGRQALDGFGLENGQVTHAIVDRFFGLDDGGVAIRVYASDPDRGGGGYLLAAADGTVIELVG